MLPKVACAIDARRMTSVCHKQVVDANQGLDPDHQAEHATRAINQDPVDAIIRNNNKVESAMMNATNDILAGNADRARVEFGGGLHNIQDRSAPAHRDENGIPKPYEGGENKWGTINHVWSDLSQDLDDPPAQKAMQDTQRAINDLDERVRLEGEARGMSKQDVQDKLDQFYGQYNDPVFESVDN